MKAVVLAALALVSSSAVAADIVVDKSGYPVQIDAVEVTLEGTHWPQTVVEVKATFGNPCAVPTADELVKVISYSESFDNLELSLLSVSHRVCTLEYNPTTVTIALGAFTRPNDGLFTKVIVNGVEATTPD